MLSNSSLSQVPPLEIRKRNYSLGSSISSLSDSTKKTVPIAPLNKVNNQNSWPAFVNKEPIRYYERSLVCSKKENKNKDVYFFTLKFKRPVDPFKIYRKPAAAIKIAANWNRARLKYNIRKQNKLSPVRQIITMIKPDMNPYDYHMSGFLWILSMSEQFFYENTLTLLTNTIEVNMGSILMKNVSMRSANQLTRSWTEIVKLGSGSYGSFYRVTDAETQEKFVVKYISEFYDNYTAWQTFKRIVSYLSERYYLMQAYDSPFIVRFKYSFMLQEASGLCLAMEYCICDLSTFLKLFNKITMAPILMLNGTSQEGLAFLEMCFNEIFRKNGFDLLEIFIVYVYELFCMLDFLGNCNIIHRDFKLKNLMIGVNGHLKLGDFGLVNVTRFMYGQELTNMWSLNVFDLIQDEANKKRKEKRSGTLEYMEMEILLEKLDQSEFNKLSQNQHYTGPHSQKHDFIMDFLSDLFSVGIVISKLMFLGMNIFNPNEFYSAILPDLGMSKKDTQLNTVKLFYDDNIYKLYIEKGLEKFKGGKMGDIFYILSTIIKFRDKRGEEITKPASFFSCGTEFQSRKVDLDLIDKFDVFKSRNISKDMISMHNFPLLYLEFLSKIGNNQTINPLTADKWIDSLKQYKSHSTRQLLKMEPGFTMEF